MSSRQTAHADPLVGRLRRLGLLLTLLAALLPVYTPSHPGPAADGHPRPAGQRMLW